MSYHQRIREVLPSVIQNHFTSVVLKNEIKCVIGYGSGVFPQLAKPTKNTVDLIIIVKNANRFHQQMFGLHASDYAGLSKFFGPPYLDLINRFVFPAHFNHIETQDIKIKYSVVEEVTVLKDLKTWNLLTIAGRLHKPVFYNVTGQKEDGSLKNMFHLNHMLALNVALLTLIGKFPPNNQISLEYLYSTIARISYAGDIRHTLAIENKHKIENIVCHNLSGFNQIYLPWIKKLNLSTNSKYIELKENFIAVKYSPQLIYKLCLPGSLPFGLVNYLQNIHASRESTIQRSLGEKILLNGVHEVPRHVEKWLAGVNKKSSLRMALSNFLGGSLAGNMKYLLAKLYKKGQK